MDAVDHRDALVALTRGRARLDALKLRLLAEADRSGATTETGAGSAADWIAVGTRQVRRDARSDLKLAAALERHEVLATAMAQGRVNIAQARAIVAALDRLPTTGEFAVSTEQSQHAEDYLVDQAQHHDAKALRILGLRIFEVIAPNLAEQLEGRALEAEEALALRRTTLTMREDGGGTCHGRFRIPALHGQMLTKMILAIASPGRSGRDHSSGIEPDLPTPVRHGLALTQLIETIRATALPKTGGCSATVVVTMTLDQLTAEPPTKPGSAPWTPAAASPPAKPDAWPAPPASSRSSWAATARSSTSAADTACTPKACGSRECPRPRLHRPRLPNPTRNVPGPPRHPRSHGGSTNADTGRLLCPHHHRRIHDPNYETRRMPGGKVAFHRRT